MLRRQTNLCWIGGSRWPDCPCWTWYKTGVGGVGLVPVGLVASLVADWFIALIASLPPGMLRRQSLVPGMFPGGDVLWSLSHSFLSKFSSRPLAIFVFAIMPPWTVSDPWHTHTGCQWRRSWGSPSPPRWGPRFASKSRSWCGRTGT